MNEFKVPDSIPQDLLLIQDIVGIRRQPPEPEIEDDDINSSGSSDDSSSDDSSSDDSSDEVNEVEANLIVKDQEEDTAISLDSCSDPDSSSDDLEDIKAVLKDEDCEDEDSGPSLKTATYFRTTNEVAEVEISIPTVEEVGPEEVLEKVGEIMNIADDVAIVKGDATGCTDRKALERALDSDTLLVFEDRKVLGYIYDTFGPTSQPFYQIKFNQKYPLNPEKVLLSRAVYHLPNRSNFVFPSQLKKWKGSDASNVHDEEPAEYELDFSDDEEEAAYKRRRRAESRGGSVAGSSRYSTPTPSQMRDQDLIQDDLPSSSGAYDYDFSSAGPSRPAVIPYDDPYADEYKPEKMEIEDKPITDRGSILGRRGRGRGSGRGNDRRRDSGGWNHGRGGRNIDRGRGGRWGGIEGPQYHDRRGPSNQGQQAPTSPTSLAIVRGTGQFDRGEGSSNIITEARMGGWPQQQYPILRPQNQFQFGQPGGYVQPHINPRFASQFGMNLGFQGPPQYYPQEARFGQPYSPIGDWADQWTVHGHGASDSNLDTGHDNVNSSSRGRPP